MTNADDRRLERSLDRLQGRLPNWIARPVGGLRKPDARWIRIPTGILFIIGGFVGFLPILGFWMVPLGVLLFALDIPFLRRPTSGTHDPGGAALVEMAAKTPRQNPLPDSAEPAFFPVISIPRQFP